MTEALLIVAGGLLGSAHCIGMCGGFVLTLGSQAPTWWVNLGRQLLYAAGRISVYTLAGACVGFGSWRVGRELQSVVNIQALLSIVAGTLLIAEALAALGFVPRLLARAHRCPGAVSFAELLRTRAKTSVFAAGVVNGLLPCGLVYAYLALAASAEQMGEGALVMLLFGLGTVPALALTGLGGSLLSLPWRRRLFQAAAWCMLATGLLALSRGAGFLDLSAVPAAPICPYCTD